MRSNEEENEEEHIENQEENENEDQGNENENENEPLSIEEKPENGEKKIKIISKKNNKDDFDSLDLGDFEEKTPNKESQKANLDSSEKAPLGEESIEKGTTMVVLLFDLLNSKLCGWFSGNDSGTYRLTKTEKNEIVESATAYFKTINFEASPLGVFGLTVLTIMLSKWITVYKDYDRNKALKSKNKIIKIPHKENIILDNHHEHQTAKIVEFRPKMYEPQPQPTPEKPKNLAELENEILKNLDNITFVEKHNKRGKFQFYTTGKYKGFYEFSTTGKRYACEAAKEHLKEENNQPTAAILNNYNLLYNFLGNDKEAQSKLGKLIRKVKNITE